MEPITLETVAVVVEAAVAVTEELAVAVDQEIQVVLRPPPRPPSPQCDAAPDETDGQSDGVNSRRVRMNSLGNSWAASRCQRIRTKAQRESNVF